MTLFSANDRVDLVQKTEVRIDVCLYLGPLVVQ